MLRLGLLLCASAAIGCTPISGVPPAGSTSQPDGGSAEAGADSSNGRGRMESRAQDDARTDGGSAGDTQDRQASAAGSGGVRAASAGAAGADIPASASVSGQAAQGGETASEPAAEPASREPLDPSQTSILTETADADALSRLSDWSLLPVLRTEQFRQQASSARRPVTDASAQPTSDRDFNHFKCKSADADVRPAALAPLEYDMPTCSDDYVRGVVMARYVGSGRMTRFWLTASPLVTGGSLTDEVLRIYVDDNPRAVIQVPLEQVLSGGAGEIFANPFGSTSKYYVAWHYPITFSSKLIAALDHVSANYYFQVDAVLDAPAQKRTVPRARSAQRDRAHTTLEAASPVPASAGTLHTQPLMLDAGEQRSVTLTGPATIRELRLRVAKDQLSTLSAAKISVRWDGAAEPAIDLPLLDLFMASQAVIERGGLAIAASVDADTQVLALRLPMPFRTSAEWDVHNGASAPIALSLEWIGDTQLPEAEFGHLSVQRHAPTLPQKQLEQTLAVVNGRGRYVGLCADLGGHRDPGIGGSSSLDMLQGDIRALADGERAIDSTGTEDYANNSYFFADTPRGLPFAQSWGRVESSNARPPGQVSFCRWQVLGNEVDFQREFRLIRELANGDASLAERHHILTFFYLQ